MNPEEFASRLHSLVSHENLSLYRDLFVTTSAKDVKDPYWKEALSLYDDLTAEQRKVLLDVIQQVSIDTTSNILGILDGACTLGDSTVDLQLVCADGRLDGDLQSLFLNEAGRERP